MNEIEKQGRALEQAIASRIRKKRLNLGWSLDRLAKVTGLSKGYLSQIENSEKKPPIGTLTKIAYGLGENVITLITGDEIQKGPTKFSLARADERVQITHTGASPGSIYESLGFNKPDRFMESYIVTVDREFPPNPFIHGGQELVFGLDGTQEFWYDGRVYTANAGDALYFDSDRPHMARSLGKKPARVLVVFCNPLR